MRFNILRLASIITITLSATYAFATSPTTAPVSTADADCPAVLKYEFNTLERGNAVNLCTVKAKAILVVNTASECGYTPQYDGLEKLHKRYAKDGLVIVGVPANDFGSQEKGSNAQIATFCKSNYGVSFLMSQKLEMPLKDNSLFANLIKASGEAPKWNFHKYLIKRDNKVQSFGTKIDPQSASLKTAIEAALK